jgi:hypothetical protein
MTRIHEDYEQNPQELESFKEDLDVNLTIIKANINYYQIHQREFISSVLNYYEVHESLTSKQTAWICRYFYMLPESSRRTDSLIAATTDDLQFDTSAVASAFRKALNAGVPNPSIHFRLPGLGATSKRYILRMHTVAPVKRDVNHIVLVSAPEYVRIFDISTISGTVIWNPNTIISNKTKLALIDQLKPEAFPASIFNSAKEFTRCCFCNCSIGYPEAMKLGYHSHCGKLWRLLT